MAARASAAPAQLQPLRQPPSPAAPISVLLFHTTQVVPHLILNHSHIAASAVLMPALPHIAGQDTVDELYSDA